MKELEVNGVLLDDVADTVQVNQNSALNVDINGVDVWSRIAVVPYPIVDFQASSNLTTQINCTWTTGSDTLSTDLYEETLGLIQANALTGFAWLDAVPGVTYKLYVLAIGTEATSVSNVDEGSLLVQGSVTVDYDAISGPDALTVSGSLGNFIFTPPLGVTEVTACMCGAGGSGCAGFVIFTAEYVGGGSQGAIISDKYPVTPLVPLAITIGVGGARTSGGGNLSNPGTSTSLEGIGSCAGGAGGVRNGIYQSVHPDTPFEYCGGTFYDGIAYLYIFNGLAYGGQSGAFGSGGDGQTLLNNHANNGGIGAGGGGHAGSEGGNEQSGAGGNGRIVISWGV